MQNNKAAISNKTSQSEINSGGQPYSAGLQPEACTGCRCGGDNTEELEWSATECSASWMRLRSLAGAHASATSTCELPGNRYDPQYTGMPNESQDVHLRFISDHRRPRKVVRCSVQSDSWC